MAVTIGEKSISRVLIVDDEAAARDGYAYAVEDMGLEPIRVKGPVAAHELVGSALSNDAMVCDYHLKKHDYAECNGDVLMARCFKAGIPGILCTTFSDVGVTIRRDCLRYISALRRTNSPKPNELWEAWEACFEEMRGEFKPNRRPWRTLVRVVEVEHDHFYAVVPSWDHVQKVRIFNDSVPPDVRDLLAVDKRFHAQVNKGAESYEELFFDDWELE